MPATEATWRDSQSLHRVFAVTGVVLTISTLWMFWKDHARSWKTYQVTVNNIDLKMNKLRQQQFETGDAVLEHEQRAAELAAAKALPVDPVALAEFKTQAIRLDKELNKWRNSGHSYSTVNADLAYIDRTAKRLEDLAAKAQQARADVAQGEKGVEALRAAADAEARSAEVRDELVAYLKAL